MTGVAAELDVTDLEVVGELPADLDGAYVRTGPDPRSAPLIGSFLHPVDGDGVVHELVLSEGRARHVTRPVRTPAFARHEEGGRTPTGIRTHPKIDGRTGETFAVCSHLRPPFLTWAVFRPDGPGRTVRPVEGVERPSMIHDMAITDRYLVLVVAPLFFDVESARSGGSPVAWEEAAGTRTALVPRDGGPVRWCDDDTFWLWHTANAHDAKDPVDPVADVVVLDYVQWGRPFGFVPGAKGAPRLARAVLDPAAGTVRRETLSDLTVEFPRIDDRLLGRPHPVSAFAMRTTRPRPHPGCWEALAWYDTRSRVMTRWEPADLAVGEPAFASDPRSDAPDRGWWLTYATCFGDETSSLLVIPAGDPGSGPVATIRCRSASRSACTVRGSRRGDTSGGTAAPRVTAGRSASTFTA